MQQDLKPSFVVFNFNFFFRKNQNSDEASSRPYECIFRQNFQTECDSASKCKSDSGGGTFDKFFASLGNPTCGGKRPPYFFPSGDDEDERGEERVEEEGSDN